MSDLAIYNQFRLFLHDDGHIVTHSVCLFRQLKNLIGRLHHDYRQWLRALTSYQSFKRGYNIEWNLVTASRLALGYNIYAIVVSER